MRILNAQDDRVVQKASRLRKDRKRNEWRAKQEMLEEENQTWKLVYIIQQ